MLRLEFSVADLNLAENRDKTRRSSVSGVQDKVQLRRVRGGFEVVESGGAFGVPEDEVRDGLAEYAARQEAVERLLAASRLSPEAKARYLAKFRDRLRAIAQ